MNVGAILYAADARFLSDTPGMPLVGVLKKEPSLLGQFWEMARAGTTWDYITRGAGRCKLWALGRLLKAYDDGDCRLVGRAEPTAAASSQSAARIPAPAHHSSRRRFRSACRDPGCGRCRVSI